LTAQIRHSDRTRFAHEVGYLLPHKDALVPDLQAAGIPLTCFRARGSADMLWLRRLRRHVIERKIAIVHVHSPVAAAGARVVARTIGGSRRPRIVTTEHNVWQSHARATRIADAITARLDDAHLAVSSAVRASLPPWLAARTEVVRHGIDVAAVAAQRGERDAVRRELGLVGRVVVGTVANLRATKGLGDLLAAARQVADEAPEVVFVVVGQGPLQAELEARQRELGLADHVRLLGFRPDAVRVMAGFDVFCLPSHHEGLPVALMEAMALGLPIVATDVGGVSELVVDGEHGRLVPPLKPDVLAKAIVELATDEGRRRRAGSAVASAGQDLSAERAERRIEEIYSSLARR
jgi:glycosyltransferase involved in cell wall biosynthesis